MMESFHALQSSLVKGVTHYLVNPVLAMIKYRSERPIPTAWLFFTWLTSGLQLWYWTILLNGPAVDFIEQINRLSPHDLMHWPVALCASLYLVLALYCGA